MLAYLISPNIYILGKYYCPDFALLFWNAIPLLVARQTRGNGG